MWLLLIVISLSALRLRCCRSKEVGFDSLLARRKIPFSPGKIPFSPGKIPFSLSTGIGSQALEGPCDFWGETTPIKRKSRFFPSNREFGQRAAAAEPQGP